MASTQKLWQQNNNRLYWLKREQKQRELYMKEEEQQQKELEKIYADMYRRAEQEINAFYGKYADAEGIDITEAKKRVSQLDIEEYERLAKQYVADKDFSARANAEMRLYNATMRINRLEMLKARIGLHLIDGINTIDDYYEKEITDRTKEEIERQAGILGQTITNADTVKRAKEIVNASFFNATYSDRIWSHMDNLRSEISIQLQRGLIAGVGSREMARRIKEYAYDKSFADAHRLMVTELRRVQTDVAMSAYKDQGVERYVYLAVNPNACPICRALNGKDYPVEGAEIANEEHPLPPMHPRCHCTTAPYVPESTIDPTVPVDERKPQAGASDYDQWLWWLNNGGTTKAWGNMSLTERQTWYDNLIKSRANTKASTWSRDDVVYSNAGKLLKNRLERKGVEYRQVEEWAEQPTERKIIQRLGGGDQTKGSCLSLACAYAGNKLGLNVIDYRGGDSREIFAFGYESLARLAGVNAIIEKKGGIRPAKKLLEQMEEGKEYIFTTGRHSAITKIEDGKYKYLELQTESRNGWQDFEGGMRNTGKYDWEKGEWIMAERTTSDTLRDRFGAKGYTVSESSLIEIDSLEDSDEFRDLLGYINTESDKQKKGSMGYAK